MPLIEHHALLGDRRSAALVSRDGSVDWLCWPRFDSPACLAALLGGPEHGRWRLAPEDGGARPSRRYRGDTLVLETAWETADGAVTVVDCMPLPDGAAPSTLVRLVVGTRGRVSMRGELALRFGYGARVPRLVRLGERALRAVVGDDAATLRADVPLALEGDAVVARFHVAAGERAAFALTHGEPADERSLIGAAAAVDATVGAWGAWAARCTYAGAGEWRDAVVRSLLTLSALTHAPTGGIVAAPTTSLPQILGGTRNWDYRYCWLRDATLTLAALVGAGFRDEAAAWRDWLLRVVDPADARIVYGVAGERDLRERVLPWLPGYEGASPVRVGNAAHAQRQLDVPGEVLDALYRARVAGLAEDVRGDAWRLERALVADVERRWREPDAGIWEVRGEPRHFTHSKVMAWVAVDRALRSAERSGLPAPLDRWRALRERIHADVCRHAWSDASGSFVQAYGSRHVDASTLLLPVVGFLPPDDPRVRATVARVEERLLVDGLVLRYEPEALPDASPGDDAFLACSFWLVEALALVGRRARARALFERLLALRNDVGLLAEGYDTRARRQVGNFPQGFSHVALVDAALALGGAPGVATALADEPASR